MQRAGPSVESGLHAALLPGDLERGGRSSSSQQPSPLAAADGYGQKWWAHELSCSSIASSDGGYTQQPWLPDEVSAHCMLCAKPFHFWRWTHHCRDCGGLYCDACSTHRVEVRRVRHRNASHRLILLLSCTHPRQASGNDASWQLTALRLCDTCAFSPSHPQHLGCASPCACPRCTGPRSVGQLIYYAKAAVWELICLPFCCWGWSSVAQACAASTDARMKRNSPKRSQPAAMQSYLGPAAQPPDARPVPQRIGTAPPRTTVPSKAPGGGAARGAGPRGPLETALEEKPETALEEKPE